MPAANYDFEIEQGATLSKTFVWKDSTGWPIPLTDYTAKLQVRKNATSDALMTLSTEAGTIVIEPKGKVRLKLSAAETSAIAWTRGKYALELTSPDGDVTRLVSGEITVSKEITRD